MTFRFQDPVLLTLLLLVPALLVVFFLRKKAYASLLSPNIALFVRTAKSPVSRSHARLWLFSLRVLALCVLIFALARPQWGSGARIVDSSGIDIVLALDFSSSMLALDFSTKTKPISRLDVAKEVLQDFIHKRPEDRLALIAFAHNPYLVSPLTVDHHFLTEGLEALQIGVIPDGTAIGSAILLGVHQLKQLPSKSRVLILLTDGVNNAGETNPKTAAQVASNFGVKIYTVAVGKGGIVPAYLLGADGTLLKDRFGQKIVEYAQFPVDTETLVAVSELTGAKSYQASNLEELKSIYSDIDHLEKTEVKVKQFSQYEEWYSFFILGAFILLFIEFILKCFLFRMYP